MFVFTSDAYDTFSYSRDKIAKWSIANQDALVDTVGNFLGITEEGHLSYLPAKLCKPYANDYNGTIPGRISGKPVRIMKKFMPNPERFTEVEWTEFGLWVESHKQSDLELSLVSGEDIRYWYHEDRYGVYRGPLHNSCMKKASCQSYFDIYVNNPNQVSMLVATRGDRLYGRVLVWTCTDGKRYMDRKYADTKISALFDKWATENDVRHTYRLDKITVQLDTPQNTGGLPYFDSWISSRTGLLKKNDWM